MTQMLTLLAWVRPRQDGREEQREEFEHALRIADFPLARGFAASQVVAKPDSAAHDLH
jgi:hypothetical protein